MTTFAALKSLKSSEKVLSKKAMIIQYNNRTDGWKQKSMREEMIQYSFPTKTFKANGLSIYFACA